MEQVRFFHSNTFSGNKYTRDLGEDFPTEIDADSEYVRHEESHTSRSFQEFANVTTNLKERRQRGPKRDVPRSISSHSRRPSIPKSAGKIKKEKEYTNLAKKKRAKRIIEQQKTNKKEIKIEFPHQKEPGFRLDDYVQGTF